MILDKPKVIPAVRPNLGVEYKYRKRLYCLIEAMHNSIIYWIVKAYERNAPKMANDNLLGSAARSLAGSPQLTDVSSVVADGHGDPLEKPLLSEDYELSLAFLGADALPSTTMRRALAKLVTRWQRKFNEAAPELAKRFAKDVATLSDVAFAQLLKKNKINVSFKMGPAQRDVLNATVQQNVSLIKSIPAQYLSQVQGVVMRSVQMGSDPKSLAKSLRYHFNVSKKRAALIAEHQSAAATSALHRARQVELGIQKAVWKHSHRDKHPRPTHLKMDNKVFDVLKGMWDSAVNEYVFPGQLVGCTCTSYSIIPGLGG